MILSTIDCKGSLSVSLWQDWGSTVATFTVNYWDLKALSFYFGARNLLRTARSVNMLINKWNGNESEYSRGSFHYLKKKRWLYIKKRTRLPFNVLLSARRAATLQKITVLLTQAKRGSQAGARKKCQTKAIYLVACLLPLITQHYCLYNPNSRRGELRNKHRKWENECWGSEWGRSGTTSLRQQEKDKLFSCWG